MPHELIARAEQDLCGLRNAYRGERAVVIFGGPSVLENHLDLSRLDTTRWVVFLESKALTPRFAQFGLEPQFYTMFYPEKSKANSLQTVAFQSFLAGIDVKPLVRPEFHAEIDSLTAHFDQYCEPWKPSVPHKRYRWRPDVYLKNSPFDVLQNFKKMALLSYLHPFRQYVSQYPWPNPLYVFDLLPAQGAFELGRYYETTEEDGRLKIRDFSFTNSAAIALFPLLQHLGFQKVYFLGMDMSMLGSMEYAALYTFRSLAHFETFFERARPVFSATFPRGPRWWQRVWSQVRGSASKRSFVRPASELESLRTVLAWPNMEFVNVYEPFEHAVPLPGIRNIPYAELLRE